MKLEMKFFGIIALCITSFVACNIGQEMKDDLSANAAKSTNSNQNFASQEVSIMKLEVVPEAPYISKYAVFVGADHGRAKLKCVGHILGETALRNQRYDVNPDEGLGAQLVAVLPAMNIKQVSVIPASIALIEVAKRVIVRIGDYTFTLYNTTCSQVYTDWYNCGGINVPLSGNGSSFFNNNGTLDIFCHEANGNCQITMTRQAEQNTTLSTY